MAWWVKHSLTVRVSRTNMKADSLVPSCNWGCGEVRGRSAVQAAPGPASLEYESLSHVM